MNKQEVNIKNTILCPDCGSEVESSKTTCMHCESELKLQGKYELWEILGENIGTTYKARFNDKFVVIKELSLRVLNQWKSEELFRRESEILSQLKHEAIPAFIEEFECGIGRNAKSYIVMEHIEGMSLREEFKTKRYTESEVMDILFEIAEILGFLHDLRPPVIHRDLKLSNIMRRSNGKLAIIDFGSVKNINKSQSATVLGTYGFMAPEQFSGRATFASDFYSLGVIALVLLSRKEPEDMMENGVQLNWKKELYANAEMVLLLEKLLEPSPEFRIASLEDFKHAKSFVEKEINQRQELKAKKFLADELSIKKSNEIVLTEVEENKNTNLEIEKKEESQQEIEAIMKEGERFKKAFHAIENIFSKIPDRDNYKLWQKHSMSNIFIGSLILSMLIGYGDGVVTGSIVFSILLALSIVFLSVKTPNPQKFLQHFLKHIKVDESDEFILMVLESWAKQHQLNDGFTSAFKEYMDARIWKATIQLDKLDDYRNRITNNTYYQSFVRAYMDKEYPNDLLKKGWKLDDTI